MALNKQIQVYSLDTSSFYNEEEMRYHTKIIQLQGLKNKVVSIKEKKQKEHEKGLHDESLREEIKRLISIEKLYKKMIKREKERLTNQFQITRFKNNQLGKIRQVRPEEFCPKNVLFLRWHYPDQVHGYRGYTTSSQPADLPAPLQLTFLDYYGRGLLSM